MLTMKLFGPLDVRVGGVARPTLGSMAAAELLALLALHYDRGLRSAWVADSI